MILTKNKKRRLWFGVIVFLTLVLMLIIVLYGSGVSILIHRGLSTIGIVKGYQSARPFSDGLAAVEIENRWGYIDQNGNWAISPQYKDARDFSDDKAFVRRNDGWGYINKHGDTITAFKYEWSYGQGQFSEERAAVRMEGQWGYINKKGETVIPPQYDWASEFYNGYAWIKKDGKKGFINSAGDTVIPVVYQDARHFHGGLAPVKKDGSWGYINRRNEVVISFQYHWASSFKNGRAWVQTGNQKKIYINTDGERLTNKNYLYTGPYRSSRALVGNRKFFKYLTRDGTSLNRKTYSLARPYTDGFAAVKKSGQWGYINVRGDEVISPRYDAAKPFSEGLAPVKRFERWYYIDRSGQQYIAPWSYDSSDEFTSYKRGLFKKRTLVDGLIENQAGHRYGSSVSGERYTTHFHGGAVDARTLGGEYFKPLPRGVQHPHRYKIWQLFRPDRSDRKHGKWEMNRYPHELPSVDQGEVAEELVNRGLSAGHRNNWFNRSRQEIQNFLIEKGPHGTTKMDDRFHYLKRKFLLDERLVDPDRPEFFMYYGTPRGMKLAGYMFLTKKLLQPGPQVGGSWTIWHFHELHKPVCLSESLFPTDYVPGEPCPHTYSTRSPEMFHVWFVDHPNSKFATRMQLPERIINHELASEDFPPDHLDDVF